MTTALGHFDGTPSSSTPIRAAARTPTGTLHLQLRPPRGAQLPDLQRAVLARRLSHRRAARRRASPRCCTSTTRASRASGCRTRTAATTTSTRSQFLQEFNEVVYGREPGVRSRAEESTAWAGVSRPTGAGGLGFGFKWNMGWMHDTLGVLRAGPGVPPLAPRRADVPLVYAYTENFILPLSHDEVVHGKGSLLGQDAGRPVAEVREAALALRLPVGAARQEAAVHGRRARRWRRVEPRRSSTGSCSATPRTPASRAGRRSQWRVPGQARRCTVATATGRASGGSSATTATRACSRSRARSRDSDPPVVVVANFTPVPREGYRSGCRAPGAGASSSTPTPPTTAGRTSATSAASRPGRSPGTNQPFSAEVRLPPLGTLWLVPDVE